MLSSIQDMIADLETAKTLSTDQPDLSPLSYTRPIHAGGRGRPRIEIDSNVLEAGLQLAGPTRLAHVFGVSARTVQRRGLEQGIVQPGDPVYVNFTSEDGQEFRLYTSSTGSQSDLSDDQLDAIMVQILNSFPTFGQRMIEGHLQYLGHHIPRRRIQESYARVHGPPVAAFGLRRIQRRIYHVSGFNSLQHHDGQHGKLFDIIAKYYSSILQRSYTMEAGYPCFH